MTKVYADTCIYRDFLEGRKDNYRDLAQFAQNFFAQVEDGTYKLVYSQHVITEYKKHNTDDKLDNFLDTFNNKEEVLITKEDRLKANQYQNKQDALHAILAIKSNCMYLTTRNIKDFDEFIDDIEIIWPESL